MNRRATLVSLFKRLDVNQRPLPAVCAASAQFVSLKFSCGLKRFVDRTTPWSRQPTINCKPAFRHVLIRIRIYCR